MVYVTHTYARHMPLPFRFALLVLLAFTGLPTVFAQNNAYKIAEESFYRGEGCNCQATLEQLYNTIRFDREIRPVDEPVYGLITFSFDAAGELTEVTTHSSDPSGPDFIERKSRGQLSNIDWPQCRLFASSGTPPSPVLVPFVLRNYDDKRWDTTQAVMPNELAIYLAPFLTEDGMQVSPPLIFTAGPITRR